MPLCCPGAILSLFYPPFFREWLWSHSPMVWKKERTLPLGISENRPLYFCPPLFAGTGPGGQGVGSYGKKRESATELLSSHRCAGMVTLANSSGAERLNGLCACFCRGGQSVRTENRYALYLQIKMQVFQIKAVLSSFWVVCVFQPDDSFISCS